MSLLQKGIHATRPGARREPNVSPLSTRRQGDLIFRAGPVSRGNREKYFLCSDTGCAVSSQREYHLLSANTPHDMPGRDVRNTSTASNAIAESPSSASRTPPYGSDNRALGFR